MFTRPEDFSDDAVVVALMQGWAIRADAVEYFPMGFGSHHWRVEAGGSRWFVTADDLRARKWSRSESQRDSLTRLRAALSTAHRLRDDGLKFVVAPITTMSGEVLHVTDSYPYVPGETPDSDTYQSHAERVAVLELIATLHHATGPTIRNALVDDFTITDRDELTVALTELSAPWDTGPCGEPARTLLAQHAHDVEHALNRYDGLVEAAQPRVERAVLTHGEPHPRNTLRSGRELLLIDWDTALLAPPERDIWTLADGDPKILNDYEALTGVEMLSDTLALYRLRWDLTEISIYVGLFRHHHRQTTDTTIAWAGLSDYLDPRRWAPA
jgi:spectinomycin phosphotransferase